MAALLPGAEDGLTLVEAGAGKLAVAIDGVILKDRKARLDYLRSRMPVQVFEAKLDDVVARKRAVQAGVEQADLIVITSQEIDLPGEADSETLRAVTNLR